MSSHPMRRGRPVVVPYSAPTSRSSSANDPWISVGYGPSPTRVVYAFTCSSANRYTQPAAADAMALPSLARMSVRLHLRFEIKAKVLSYAGELLHDKPNGAQACSFA